MSEEENGVAASPSYTHPGEEYRKTRQRQRDWSRLTEEEKQNYRQRIDELKKELNDARMAAATHAGKLGFVYRPETNDYVRMVSGAVLPPPVERPSLPAYEKPPTYTAPKPVGQQVKTGWKAIAATAHWWLAMPIGAFIGYGLGKLAGLITDRAPYWFWLSLLLGISLIFGMKLLLGICWRLLGRKKALGDLQRMDVPLAATFTTVILALEGWLGGQAFALYSRQAGMSPEEYLDPRIAFQMAIAVSIGVVLFSAFKGYEQGQNGITEADLEQRHRDAEAEWVKKENERREREYARLLAEYEEKKARAQQKEDTNRQAYDQEQEEFNSYRKMPEYQALLGYLGLIPTLIMNIEDLEREATNLSISRGHERASLH